MLGGVKEACMDDGMDGCPVGEPADLITRLESVSDWRARVMARLCGRETWMASLGASDASAKNRGLSIKLDM